MKKLLLILGVLTVGQITAKTVFFPNGPQEFNTGVPFSIYNAPSLKKGLPVQLAVLGKDENSILVYDGNNNRIKRIDLSKAPEELVKKAESLEEIHKTLLENIFIQGTLPEFINFLPGEFKNNSSNKEISVKNGVFHISKNDGKNSGTVSSTILINTDTKFLLIKFEAKSDIPKQNRIVIELNPIGRYPLYQTNDITQKWSTQWIIFPPRSTIVRIKITNKHADGNIQLKNIRIYPL